VSVVVRLAERRLIETAYYMNFSNLIDELHQIIDGTLSRDESAWSFFRSVSVMVIDDVGAEELTKMARSKLYLLLNYRYENLFPVICTSNYPIAKLEKRFRDKEMSDRITSRLKKMTDEVMIG